MWEQCSDFLIGLAVDFFFSYYCFLKVKQFVIEDLSISFVLFVMA